MEAVMFRKNSLLAIWALLLPASFVPCRAEIRHFPSTGANLLRLDAANSLTILSQDTTLKLKSKGTATALSGLCSGIPVALGLVMALQSDGTLFEDPTLTTGMGLITGGMIFGPAAGYFYVEDYGRGLEGIGIRTATAGIFIFIAISVENRREGNEGGLESLNGVNADIGRAVQAVTIMAIGTGIVLISDIIDIVKVHKSVEKYNARLTAGHTMALSIAPTFGGTSRTPGLILRVAL